MTNRAIVVSDFPIVARTAQSILTGQYDVTLTSWHEFLQCAQSCAHLFVFDITTNPLDTVLPLVVAEGGTTRLAVCSLHQNEVTVYKVENAGLTRELELPNLLALTA